MFTFSNVKGSNFFKGFIDILKKIYPHLSSIESLEKHFYKE